MDEKDFALGTGLAPVILQVNLIELLISSGALKQDAVKDVTEATTTQLQAFKLDQWYTADVIAVAHLRLSQALMMMRPTV